MIEKRGAERHSMITGSSTHNQRIEHYRLFYYMEHHDLLNPLDEHHLWALHYVYVPRISRSLNEFRNSWNNHPMRTTSHKSPIQLFTAGLLLLQNSQLSAMDFFEDVEETYGIDPQGPVSVASDDSSGIEIPQSTLHFLSRIYIYIYLSK